VAIYYLSTRPETIVSILRSGQLPIDLAEWVMPKQMCCFEDFASSVRESQTSYDQTFVLVLQVPFRLSGMTHHSFILEKIEPDWIQRTVVYSKLAQRLLERLYKIKYPKPIMIEKARYPVESSGQPANQVARKRKHKEVAVSEQNAQGLLQGAEPKPKKKETIQKSKSRRMGGCLQRVG